MGLLAQLAVVDLRGQLPRQACQVRKGVEPSDALRCGPVTSLTLHFNGPAVKNRTPAGERRQLVVDAGYHVRTLGADGLQYHFAIGADGTIYQTRDLNRIAWHAANAGANRQSLAIHLPVGGTQNATDAQWLSFVGLCYALIADYDLSGRDAVKGHCEWPRTDGKRQKDCPGPVLMPRLRAWRVSGIWKRYRVLAPTIVYTARDLNSRQATINGVPVVFPTGHIFTADDLTGNWLHDASGIGFVAFDDVEAI